MKLRYSLLLAAMFAAIAYPRTAAAQEFTECSADQDACVVDWGSPETGPIINALRNTVANDTDRPEGRVYVLQCGGYYWNEDRVVNAGFHLRLIGEEPTADCTPAVIQRVQREDGTTDALMIESSGDGNGGFTLENLWLQGQNDAGVTANYEPITINSSDSRFVMDNVIFDRNDWHHLGFKAGGNEIYIRNSHFRNLSDPTQIWSGRGIRLEAGADTLVFENNSFFNLTSFPVQSEAAPIEYFLFNHNTLVNFGRNFNAGGLWKEAYIANNIMVNPFWQGESDAQYQSRLDTWVAEGNDPEDLDPYIGTFSIASLPSEYGLEVDRRIVLANNDHFRDTDVEAYYGDLDIRAQPLVSDSTQSFFALYDGMVMQDNLDESPMLNVAPTIPMVYEQMGTFLEQWISGADTPWEYVYWDPGRPDPGDQLHPISINWPLPEDFSYSNETLQNAGTDDLPLGDLNWFLPAKETYLANREQYIQDIEDIAGPPVELPAGTYVMQAENAALENAEVQTVAGFTSFHFEGSGSVRWTFEVPSDGTYGLNVMTNMGTETERGQHIRIDGTGLRNHENYGEYFFCASTSTNADCPVAGDDPLAPDTWEAVEIRSSDLIADVSTGLDLTAGMHTLELAPSWGFQDFAGVEVVDAGGNVIAELTPPEAMAGGGVIENCEEEGFCPSGFQFVEIGAGGSVEWTVNVEEEGVNSGLFRLFYQSPSGSMGALLVDGTEVETLSYPSAGGDASSEVATAQFDLSTGSHNIMVTSSSGGLNLDNGILLVYEGATTANEEEALPEGYALRQNYPNPFNASTTILYELGDSSPVTLTVYDLLGRKVATLVDGVQAAGAHAVQFDSARLASGTYFYRIDTAVGQQVRKMMVVN
jgi:hypothetical protein